MCCFLPSQIRTRRKIKTYISESGVPDTPRKQKYQIAAGMIAKIPAAIPKMQDFIQTASSSRITARKKQIMNHIPSQKRV
jgi:hypothetical protein